MKEQIRRSNKNDKNVIICKLPGVGACVGAGVGAGVGSGVGEGVGAGVGSGVGAKNVVCQQKKK